MEHLLWFESNLKNYLSVRWGIKQWSESIQNLKLEDYRCELVNILNSHAVSKVSGQLQDFCEKHHIPMNVLFGFGEQMGIIWKDRIYLEWYQSYTDTKSDNRFYLTSRSYHTKGDSSARAFKCRTQVEGVWVVLYENLESYSKFHQAHPHYSSPETSLLLDNIHINNNYHLDHWSHAVEQTNTSFFVVIPSDLSLTSAGLFINKSRIYVLSQQHSDHRAYKPGTITHIEITNNDRVLARWKLPIKK